MCLILFRCCLWVCRLLVRVMFDGGWCVCVYCCFDVFGWLV